MNYADRLHAIIDGAKAALLAIDSDHLELKPSESKWSKKEILGHLIDSANMNNMRFKMAQRQSNLIFVGYDQDKMVKDQYYQLSSTESVVESWEAANLRVKQSLLEIPNELMVQQTKEHNFHQICMNKIEQEALSSLSYLVWDYLFHLEHHLAQIIPDYQTINQPFKT